VDRVIVLHKAVPLTGKGSVIRLEAKENMGGIGISHLDHDV
jgi:hypothetical protein